VPALTSAGEEPPAEAPVDAGAVAPAAPPAAAPAAAPAASPEKRRVEFDAETLDSVDRAMRLMLVLPRLMMLTPRPAIRRCASSLPRAQFDDSVVGESYTAAPPSEKQIRYAQTLAIQTETALPDAVSTSAAECSAFIDEMLNKVPPTMKQLNFASSLAEKAGIPLPAEVETSSSACSKFIDAQLQASGQGGGQGGGGGVGAASGTLPSEKQLLYAIGLAQKKNLGLPAEVLADKRSCSQFIDSLVNGIDPADGAAASVPPYAADDPFAAEAPKPATDGFREQDIPF